MASAQPGVSLRHVYIRRGPIKAISSDKDNGKKVLQAIPDPRHAAGEHQATEGQPVVQVGQQHADCVV